MTLNHSNSIIAKKPSINRTIKHVYKLTLNKARSYKKAGLKKTNKM